MKAKLFFLAAALLTCASTEATAQAIDAAPALFEDSQREIAVRFAFVPGAVEFSAYLPAGWTFSIEIDGDQNGAWGNGPESAHPTSATSGDRRFTQGSETGSFCAQYILTTRPARPDEVYASTECGGYRSAGRVEISQMDDRRRATITYRIPSAEVFDTHRDARLRACVYNGRQWACQHSLANLSVLRNPDAASAD